MGADRLMDQREVAEYLHVAVKTVENWRYIGKGPAFTKAGGGVRYRRRVVEAYLNGRTKTTAESERAA